MYTSITSFNINTYYYHFARHQILIGSTMINKIINNIHPYLALKIFNPFHPSQTTYFSKIRFNYATKNVSLDTQRKMQLYSQSLTQLLQSKQYESLAVFIQQFVIFYAQELRNEHKKQATDAKDLIFSILEEVSVDLVQQSEKQNVLQTLEYLYEHLDKVENTEIQNIRDRMRCIDLISILSKGQGLGLIQKTIDVVEDCLQGQFYPQAQKLQHQVNQRLEDKSIQLHREMIIKNSINKAIHYSYRNKLESAIKQYEGILQMISSQNHELQSTIYQSLAEIYSVLQDYHRSSGYYEKALLCQRGQKVEILIKLAEVSYKLQKYDDSLKIYAQIEDYLAQKNDFSQEQIQDYRIVILPRLGTICKKLKKMEEAIEYFTRYLALVENRQNDEEIHAKCLAYLAQSYAQTIQIQRSIDTYIELSKYHRRKGNDQSREIIMVKIKEIESHRKISEQAS